MTSQRNRIRMTGRIVLAFVALGLCSCNVYKSELCRSYVSSYNNLRSIRLEETPSHPGCISIMCGNDRPYVNFNMFSTGKDLDEYDRLCHKHNDLSYNKYRSFHASNASEGAVYNDKDFESIEVFSDKDFDELHPAGASLADIVRFVSWSPSRYIGSGYSEFYHYDPSFLSGTFQSVMRTYCTGETFSPQTDATCYPIDKMLVGLNPDDLILLGQDSPWLIGVLCFEARPSESERYKITVRMTTDSGAVFEESCTKIF